MISNEKQNTQKVEKKVGKKWKFDDIASRMPDSRCQVPDTEKEGRGTLGLGERETWGLRDEEMGRPGDGL